jgi:3'(2'), 5'-bisphosphate nucleotidase
MNNLIKTAILASIDAGQEILKIYKSDFDVEYKPDESPLTLADKNAHNIIVGKLKETNIPVLSEEGSSIPYSERRDWKNLWIVDPLDGTKEFVKKNDEFTVNIALIQNQKPILGVIYSPVQDILYFGDINFGAFKFQNVMKFKNDIDYIINNSDSLPTIRSKSYYGVVASRSHLSPETNKFIDKLKSDKENVKLIYVGSSLKLCLIADGFADIYPRFAPTSEWDIAAGHAIVNSSGGRVVNTSSKGDSLVYNKENILNPWFIAYGKH